MMTIGNEDTLAHVIVSAQGTFYIHVNYKLKLRRRSTNKQTYKEFYDFSKRRGKHI